MADEMLKPWRSYGIWAYHVCIGGWKRMIELVGTSFLASCIMSLRSNYDPIWDYHIFLSLHPKLWWTSFMLASCCVMCYCYGPTWSLVFKSSHPRFESCWGSILLQWMLGLVPAKVQQVFRQEPRTQEA